ncbi:hypothetical protein BGZ73_003741 [Actinomortierella ambigua]|nr:hypothetical protein BGZ73_003741 [Actinomortierella ambigua]
MNSIAEVTKTTINTIKIRALLSKALSSDPKPTPGYLFPEIARNDPNNTSTSTTSTHNHANAGIALSSTYDDSVHVILKALKILRQLAQSGSVEIRMQMARLAKQPLANLVGFRGELDPVHGDQWNLSVRQAADDLVEYLHAHPIQEHELVAAREREEEQRGAQSDEFDDEEGAGEFLSMKESELLKNSTQGLPGFGSPDFEDSSSDDEGDRVGRRQRRRDNNPAAGSSQSGRRSHRRPPRERTPPPEPPLPGFGNDSLDGAHGTNKNDRHPSLMGRLVDRLQELAAPAPPTAMALHAAKRQQERRRQKLFVGEYSMADELPMPTTGIEKGGVATESGSHDLFAPQPRSSTSLSSAAASPSPTLAAAQKRLAGPISIMGTNPFRRFPRQPGQILGGWAEPGEDVAQTQKWNRTMVVSGGGEGAHTDTMSGIIPRRVEETSRHPVSLQVYLLAQNIQTGFVRTSPVFSTKNNDIGREMKDKKEKNENTTPDSEDDEDELESEFMLWGTAKTICDTILKAIKAEHTAEASPSTTGSQTLVTPCVPVVTGLLRDLNDWIEHEDWDRRLTL